LNGCYLIPYHDHSEKDEEDLGWGGQWTCIFCDLTHDHDHSSEIDERDGNGWVWECDTEGCEINYKHEHRQTEEVTATPVARNDHDLSGYEDDSSEDEEEEFEAGNDLGREEMADASETSEFHKQARRARGW
jgi:hypothetical protein